MAFKSISNRRTTLLYGYTSTIRLFYQKISNRFFASSIQMQTGASAVFSFNDRLSAQLAEIKESGTWKDERIITSKQKVNINVANHSQELLNFCSNNYLGLASNDEIISASQEALNSYGVGLSSVRFICGTQDIHKDLEAKIATFHHNRPDAILYASCFDANAGIFEQIVGPDDAILSDTLNHASIIDGIRLCKAKKFRYAHMDMNDLESMLKECQNARTRIIVTDGVFSMDGNVAPLPQIRALADKYKAIVFLDECHATGFFGPNGRGTEDYYGMPGAADIINSTLGKALGGGAGGYTTGSQEVVDLLRQRSRPYLFSNSIPPAAVASASKALDILMADSTLVNKIFENTQRFRNKMTANGFTLLGQKEHPICPVMIGDAKLATDISNDMLAQGIYVIGFSYPVVPQGKARIRVQISSSHSFDDIDKVVAAFVTCGKKFRVI